MSSPARRALAASLLLALLAPAAPAAAAAPVAPLQPPLAPGGAAEQLVAADGSLWYSSYGSLVRVGPTGPASVPLPAGTHRAAGSYPVRGAGGSVWLVVLRGDGSPGSGLARFLPDGTSAVTWLTAPDVTHLAADGSEWVVASERQLLRVAGDGTATPLVLPEGIGRLLEVESDPAGGVWVGAWSGLWRLDGSTVTRVDSVAPEPVDVVEAAPAGPVWVRYLLSGGLLRLDPVTGSAERVHPVGQPGGREVAIDDAGTLWVLESIPWQGAVRLQRALTGYGPDGRLRRLVLGHSDLEGKTLAAGPAGQVWYARGGVPHRVDTTKPFTSASVLLGADRRSLEVRGAHDDGRALTGPVTVRWSAGSATGSADAVLGADGSARVPLPVVPGPTELVATADVAETPTTAGATSPAHHVYVPELSVAWSGSPGRPSLSVQTGYVDGTVTVEVDGVPTGGSHPRNGGPAATSIPLDLPFGQHRLVVRFAPRYAGYLLAESVLTVDLQPHLDRYITRVYDELLGRLPDPGGLAYWRGLLATGTPRAAVAGALSTAPEYRAAMVADTYGWVLGRAPDPAGHAYWTSRLLDGWTVQRLEAELYGSAEYYAVAGGTHEAFVTALYADVLGRAVDHGGFGYHLLRLRRGTPPRDLAASLVTSEEALRLVVDGHYAWFLGRTADEGGLRYWVGQILAGHREEEIVALLIGSDEYFAAS